MTNIEKKDFFNSLGNLAKKGLCATGVFLALSGSPAEANPSTNQKSNGVRLDLTEILAKSDGVTDKIRSKEEIAIDYIKRNLYIDGQIADTSNLDVRHKKDNEYSLSFDYELKNGNESCGKITFNIDVLVGFKDNNTSILYHNHNIMVDGKNYPKKDVFKANDGSIFDISVNGNGKTINVNTAYNKYRTESDKIRAIRQPNSSLITPFPDKINDLRNTQLSDLNNIKLGKEVFVEKDGFRRELFLQIGGNYTKIMDVKFDAEGKAIGDTTTAKIAGVDIRIYIDENFNISIPSEDKDKLINKVRQDRSTLYSMLNKPGDKSHPTFFEGLNNADKDQTWGFDADNMYMYDIVNGTYSVNINDNSDALYFKVDGNNGISLVDKNSNSVNYFYYNFGKDNYYGVSYDGKGLEIGKFNKPGENKSDLMPKYTGDPTAINLISNAVSTRYASGNLDYFDSEGNLIASIPCEKTDKGEYKINTDKTIQLDIVKLYGYKGFASNTGRISSLSKELGITDISILKIFEQCLQEEGIDLNRNCIEVKDSNGESCYYSISGKGKIERDGVYDDLKDILDLIENRLNCIKKIRNSHILWENGKQNGKPHYEEFTSFGGGQDGLGLENIDLKKIVEFAIHGNDITVSLKWGEGNHAEIQYNEKGGKPNITLKKIRIHSQEYSVSTNAKRDIILNPIEMKIKK